MYLTRASGPEFAVTGNGHRKGFAGNHIQAVRLMVRIKSLPVVIAIALLALPMLAQHTGKMADSKEMKMPAKEITGTVQSFSGNILDIKPPTVAPAVWVTIPADMKVDRDALKPGVEVSVEARWATVTFIALKPPKILAPKRTAAH
jgi:hypothetical protein